MLDQIIQDIPHFYGSSVYSIEQFSQKSIQAVLHLTTLIKNHPAHYKNTLQGKILFIDFENESTRTMVSTQMAWLKLGGQVVITDCGVGGTSKIKGEGTIDHFRTLTNYYPDAIALRCSEEFLPFKLSNLFPQIPFYNCGDGNNEHPTQALLDFVTICENFGINYLHLDKLAKLKIGFVGDIKHGRTIHSLTKLLRLFGVNVCFFAKDQLHSENDYDEIITNYERYDISELEEKAKDLDIIYATRIQKERFGKEDLELYNKGYFNYVIDKNILSKTDAILMHPFPRVFEIAKELDNHPRAAYFGPSGQTTNGLFLRMALFALTMEENFTF